MEKQNNSIYLRLFIPRKMIVKVYKLVEKKIWSFEFSMKYTKKAGQIVLALRNFFSFSSFSFSSYSMKVYKPLKIRVLKLLRKMKIKNL